MTLSVQHYRDDNNGLMEIRITGKEDIALFQQAINRAANCWDRAPAKFKTFADLVTEGRELQKYEDLGSEVKPA